MREDEEKEERGINDNISISFDITVDESGMV